MIPPELSERSNHCRWWTNNFRFVCLFIRMFSSFYFISFVYHMAPFGLLLIERLHYSGNIVLSMYSSSKIHLNILTLKTTLNYSDTGDIKSSRLGVFSHENTLTPSTKCVSDCNGIGYVLCIVLNQMLYTFFAHGCFSLCICFIP